MKRIATFDYLRTIAVFGILTCHFLFNWDITFGIGRMLGNTFNALFIAMSALLLGLGWDQNGRTGLKFIFLRHRVSKLSKVYYPFITFMFCFLIFSDKTVVSVKDILMYVMYLPWFDKLPGFEHLWFLTMIVICYLWVYFTSQLTWIFDTMGKYIKLMCYIVATIAVVFIHNVCLNNGLPGQLFLYLLVFHTCFYNAKTIIEWASKVGIASVFGCGMLFIGSAFLFINGLYDDNRMCAEWLGVFCASCVFIIVMRLFRNAKENRFVCFIANISFEVYLVHHIFAFGNYSIVNIIPNPLIAFMSLVTLSIIGGWGLKMCSIKR